jgi:hypothetical protein
LKALSYFLLNSRLQAFLRLRRFNTLSSRLQALLKWISLVQAAPAYLDLHNLLAQLRGVAAQVEIESKV